MTEKKSKWSFLIKPIVMILGLIAGSLLVLWIEKLRPSDLGFYEEIFKKDVVIARSNTYPLRKRDSTLTAEDRYFATVAWKYFENNYNENTGFVNALDHNPYTTLWDMSSYLMGMLSAYELGIIDTSLMDRRLLKCFESLDKMPLYADELPNKIYNTTNLMMFDFPKQPVGAGMGWSALSIGRFYTFVNKIKSNYPSYYPVLKKSIAKWQIEKMISDGTMNSMVMPPNSNKPRLVQDGKLGYEEYAAKGLVMAGYDLYEALSYTDFIRFKEVYGIDVPVDTREVKFKTAYNYVLSEPYVLDGIEHGWDANSRELAWRVFSAQKERYKHEKIVTCVSEDNVEGQPDLIYNAVYADGKFWNCVSENLKDANEYKTISTKAAFGWYVLFNDKYSNLLMESVKKLSDEQKGWYAGVFEKNGQPNKALTSNTNGIILECLNYKVHGVSGGH